MRTTLVPLATAGLLSWAAFSPGFGQTTVDILDIYQRFLASRFAALGCHATASATEQKFMANLTMVTTRAAMALKERNPSLSDADLSAKMNGVPTHIRGAIDGEISKNGCSSPRIQQLLALYKMHSEMSF